MVKLEITAIYLQDPKSALPVTWMIGALEDLIVALELMQSTESNSNVSKEIIVSNGPLTLEAIITDER